MYLSVTMMPQSGWDELRFWSKIRDLREPKLILDDISAPKLIFDDISLHRAERPEPPASIFNESTLEMSFSGPYPV